MFKLRSSRISSQLVSMFDQLLNSVKQYEQQKKAFGLFLSLSSTEYEQYIENIHKLFIEGDRLYPNYNNFKKNTKDNGPYVFENEQRYIANCLIAFSYTFEELIINNTQLNLQIVDNIIVLFNSGVNEEYMPSYRSSFIQKNSSKIVQLLAQGKISKYLFLPHSADTSKLPKDVSIIASCTGQGIFQAERDKAFVEGFINTSLGKHTSITLKQSEEDPNYYIVDTIKERKNGKEIITSTSDISERQACIFEPVYQVKSKKKLDFIISFDRTYNKIEYAGSLLDTFNNETSQQQTDLEYATSVMKFAASLQRAHIYLDCNGRLTFFNLVPVLLMKRGLWVTRQPFHLWRLIDALTPEELAKKYLELCIHMPEVRPNQEYHWLNGVPSSENFRVTRITGNKSLRVSSAKTTNIS